MYNPAFRYRKLLSDVYDHVYLTTELCSYDDVNLSLLGRPELGITFTKVHCWRLTQYSKCVFLDADTLVLQQCDELFERDELSAVPDTGWPDCFNSGVFVFRPSLETYAKLVALATSKGSFDGGDQGLLNTYFGDWRTDMSKRLPFLYNVVATKAYTYAPAYRHYANEVKIVHFLGSEKPWSVPWTTETGNIQMHLDHPFDLSVPCMQSWLSLFREEVLPKLPNVAHEAVKSQSETTVLVLLEQIRDGAIRKYEAPPQWQQADRLVHEYFPIHAHHQVQSSPIQPPIQMSHYEQQPPPSQPREDAHYEHQGHNRQETEKHQDYHVQYQTSEQSHPAYQQPKDLHWEAPHHHEDHQTQPTYKALADPHWEALLWHQVQSPWEPPSPPTIDYYPTMTDQLPADPKELTFGWFGANTHDEPAKPPSTISEIMSTHSIQLQSTLGEIMSTHSIQPPSLHEEYSEKVEGEDADAASVITVPPSETEEESLLRMKSWEEGHIDYMGRDNFDNIWKRLESMFITKDVEGEIPESDEVEVGSDVVESASYISLRKGIGTESVETESVDAESTISSEVILPYPEGDLSGMIDWQEGRIDYGGRDRSDNIIKRLDLIFSGKLIL